ncbi:hypothetical protein FGB62_113g02 [Gracilaria domingensis]|nr:hypothetical protein FGB62_113g02 [Gracilaria domingensis]
MSNEVVCGIYEETQDAMFEVGDVYKVKTGSDTEGLPCDIRQEKYQYYWSLLNQHKLQEISTKFEDVSIRINERGSCIDSFQTICIVVDDNKKLALLFSRKGKRCNTTGLIVMMASGTAVQNMVEHGRQIRFMQALNDENVFYVNHDNPSLRIITKLRLGSIARWMIVAANEEGVIGVKNAVMSRTVAAERRTVGAVTKTVWITVIAVFFILSILLATHLAVLVMIAKKKYETYPLLKNSTNRWQLQISMQDMREQIAKDLQLLGQEFKTESSDIRLRQELNKEGVKTLRLLPKYIF